MKLKEFKEIIRKTKDFLETDYDPFVCEGLSKAIYGRWIHNEEDHPLIAKFRNIIQPIFGNPTLHCAYLSINVYSDDYREVRRGYRLMCLGVFEQECIDNKYYLDF